MLIERLERVALLGSAWVLYLLIALSIVSLGVVIERIAFFRRHKSDINKLGDKMVDLLLEGDDRGVDELLKKDPSIEARVIRRAIVWRDGGPEAVTEAIEAELGRQKKVLDKGSTYLGTIGNNAPFIGLLGTVIGVIQAFHSLGDAQSKAAGGMGNVMAAIAEALVATGVGLVVALPAVIAFNIVAKKSSEIEANVAMLGKHLLTYLKREAKFAADFRALGVGTDQSAPPSEASSEETPDSNVGVAVGMPRLGEAIGEAS